MTTTLITGAAGFIGSHLVDALLAQGHRVIGVDNFSLGTRDNLKLALRNPYFQLVERDIADAGFADSFDAGCPVGCVWHMAANSNIPRGMENPDVDCKDTFLTTFRLLAWMKRNRVPHLAFASSSGVYGAHSRPLDEDSGPLLPISNYGAMKLASEAAISAAAESFLERIWIFRFPNVVGSRATHGAIFDFVQRLKKNRTELEVLGDGTQEKPYFHISDLLDAMLFITAVAVDKVNVFNIGTAGTTTTVRHLAEMVVQRMAPGASLRFGTGNRGWVGDVPKFTYTTKRLHRLGWSPRLTSDQAAELAVDEIVRELLG